MSADEGFEPVLRALREQDDVVIDIRGLCKLSLWNIDLAVGRGKRIAIIGRTGEGKSVLVKCLLGLMRPDAGEIGAMGSASPERRLRSRDSGWHFRIQVCSMDGPHRETSRWRRPRSWEPESFKGC